MRPSLISQNVLRLGFSRPLGLLALLGAIAICFSSSLAGRLVTGFHWSAHAATTFSVTTTADSGAGSLRQAITDANANAGPDMISFSIGSPTKTIVLTSDLPTITDPVIIDGTTQPGFSGAPIIEINGASGPTGLNITAGNSTVRGLVLNRFGSFAIRLSTNGGNHVEGNYIGTNVAGTSALPNGSGLIISSPNNIIGGTTIATRNVISGNGSRGMEIVGGMAAAGTVIQGNFIGTDATGLKSLGNGSDGIGFLNASNCLVGGTASGAGNVISGNGLIGVRMGGTGNVIQGNLIGTDAIGINAIPNGDAPGEISNTANNTIGERRRSPEHSIGKRRGRA